MLPWQVPSTAEDTAEETASAWKDTMRLVNPAKGLDLSIQVLLLMHYR